ncbi:myelin-oligodendrocyte glycoprotein-like [Anabas testudineus]|uniref:myelin-oligodendrocyte glycoprotein-like n=1 Tax=Anabas testudineus TaxID=64144 RepID=UPI000E458D44|nr:myelin-oligodendrocyte glycoprotein-like [Anabas testudineus]
MIPPIIYPILTTFVLLFDISAAKNSVKSNVTGSHEPVRAVVGEDVILPCHLEPPFDVTTLRVDWKFNGQFVHVYRSLKDDPDPQHEQFKHRTSLFHDEMHKGNISLKLTNVSEADKGHYTCYVPKLESQVKKGSVTLIVDPVERKDQKVKRPDPTGSSPRGSRLVAVIVILCFICLVCLAAGFMWWKNEGKDKHKEVSLNVFNNTDNVDDANNEDNQDSTNNMAAG